MDDPSTSTQALPAGTRIEEFVIERVLGSGGFGITYLATDTSLGRQVVIKENLPVQFCFRDPSSLTVSPRHSSGEDAENFQWSLENFSKEAAMLASLDHREIVRVLRSFQAFGTAYFVMPFVEGMALDELAKEREGKPFSEEELRGLLERVLDALGYLHERGIYHRDIKPGNILITKQNAPVLIDFGSARQRLSERSMTVVESPGYTPFEQLQSRGNVGPWSDLYALGGTLVKVMTGEAPPKAMDRMRKDPYQALVGRVDLKSRFKSEFLGTIDKALAVDEEERWQDAREWVGALNIEPFEKQYQSFLKSPHNAFEIPSFAPITGQPTAPSESNLESVSIAIPAHYNQSHLLTKVTFFGRFEIMDARGCMMLYTKNVNEFSRTKAKVFEPNGRKAVITIKARYFVEFREIFDVIDAKTGSRIGAFRRMGFMSSDWLILNANDQEVGRVRQDRKIRELQAYFDEVLVFRFKRIRHLFTRKFNLDFSDDQRGLLDRRLGLAAAVLFCFIKNKPA